MLGFANRHLGWLKPLLPRRAKRFLLLTLFGIGREGIRLPSRQMLEQDILPRLGALGFRRALFVGVAPYTSHYEAIARRGGATWATCDVNPSAAVWGAKEHVTAPIEEIDRRFPPAAFDAVIVNGVLGFGLDTPAQVERAFTAVTNVLREGGLLLLGWNSDAAPDPLGAERMRTDFRAAAELPFPPRREFASENFVFDFQIYAPRAREDGRDA
jgi:hypothetical protein